MLQPPPLCNEGVATPVGIGETARRALHQVRVSQTGEAYRTPFINIRITEVPNAKYPGSPPTCPLHTLCHKQMGYAGTPLDI